MIGREKNPILARGQVREVWTWPLDLAVNLGKVKCSFDRVVKANHEENGFKKWCKRSVRSRVYTVFKDFAVMTTTELHSLWGEKWYQETSFPDAADDCLPLRSEEQSSRERKTYDATEGDGLIWTVSVLVTAAATPNDQTLCALKQHQCISLHILRSEIQNLVQWAN